jgi:hypothetical protein
VSTVWDIVGEELITVNFASVGSRDAFGEFVPGAVTVDSTVLASVQPLNGKEAANLPEGERSKDWRKMYTRTELTPVDQATGTAGDRVIFEGVTYEVRRVGHERFVIAHFKVLLRKVQEGGA